ncbi:hypothetical protein [Streptomyces sp. NPDC096033]|uniref:hypothetical protein n=1 Tax=Streptomyces sp. NPDC096033 TaxID=3366071 RepID=UPI0037F366CF
MRLKRWHVLVPAGAFALLLAISSNGAGSNTESGPKIPPGYHDGFMDARWNMSQAPPVHDETGARNACRSIQRTVFVTDGGTFEEGWEQGCIDALLGRPESYPKK